MVELLVELLVELVLVEVVLPELLVVLERTYHRPMSDGIIQFVIVPEGDKLNKYINIPKMRGSFPRDKMLPSNNLFSLTDLKTPIHTAHQEMALGLYMMSRPATKKPVRKYATLEAARQAYRKGELEISDPIDVGV